MACSKNHSETQKFMENLPLDQGGVGRHKCAACAYEKGYFLGKNIDKADCNNFNISVIINNLEESQAQNQRHKSPHAAFALGYLEGIKEYYKK